MMVLGKRVHFAYIITLCTGVCSATTPKNSTLDKAFVFVTAVSPTLCLNSAKFERVETLLKGQEHCLKTATQNFFFTL